MIYPNKKVKTEKLKLKNGISFLFILLLFNFKFELSSYGRSYGHFIFVHFMLVTIRFLFCESGRHICEIVL